MFDPITLDQLRAFLTVVEEGSFSAAARKLQRVQSAISSAMSNLESQLGVTLWDRTTKIATLTDQGQAVLAATRRILLEVDALRRLTAGMASGVEASVSLCVDALFPLSVLVDLCAEFGKEFPAVDLRVDTQVMSTVSALILDGSASIGVVSPLGLTPGLERQVIAPIRMVPVVGPLHPLAAHKGPVPTERLIDVIQIVLSERSGPASPIKRCSRRAPGESPTSTPSTRWCAPASAGATSRAPRARGFAAGKARRHPPRRVGRGRAHAVLVGHLPERHHVRPRPPLAARRDREAL